MRGTGTKTSETAEVSNALPTETSTRESSPVVKPMVRGSISGKTEKSMMASG